MTERDLWEEWPYNYFACDHLRKGVPCYQCVVCGPAASRSPENLLEIQILGSTWDLLNENLHFERSRDDLNAFYVLRLPFGIFSNKNGNGFSSSHVQVWELDHKEGWMSKNTCFLIMVLEKTLESPLDSKEIKPINPKGNQPWIFIGRTDAEAEEYFGHLMWRANSLEKTLMLGNTEGGRRRGDSGWDG